jgi:YD repeat-containing protein
MKPKKLLAAGPSLTATPDALGRLTGKRNPAGRLAFTRQQQDGLGKKAAQAKALEKSDLTRQKKDAGFGHGNLQAICHHRLLSFKG